MKIGFFESTNFLLFYVFILNDFLGPIVLPIGSSIDLFHAPAPTTLIVTNPMNFAEVVNVKIYINIIIYEKIDY